MTNAPHVVPATPDAVLLAPSQAILARHRATATTLLLKALHYHRFFGQPIAGFSPEHNAARAESNDATVRAYAQQAGQYAFYAGASPIDWSVTHPEATLVARIYDAMSGGWYLTRDLHNPKRIIDTVATEVAS